MRAARAARGDRHAGLDTINTTFLNRQLAPEPVQRSVAAWTALLVALRVSPSRNTITSYLSSPVLRQRPSPLPHDLMIDNAREVWLGMTPAMRAKFWR